MTENQTNRIKSEVNQEQTDDLKIQFNPNQFFHQGDNYNYPVVKMPPQSAFLKLPRTGRAMVKGYKENDLLGGKDPYSASKAATELAIQSYIASFFPAGKSKISICIARAGNVIGGGDWSANRLIPDCVKSWSKKRTVLIRNPRSTRPWQHVIEAVYGYLLLALKLSKNKKLHGEAFNFGPSRFKDYDVISTVSLMKKYWKQVSWKTSKQNFYESNLLKLNSDKAKTYLGWKCILTFDKTIKMVADWYKIYYSKPKKIYQTTFNQIKEYEKVLKKEK